MPWRAPNNHPNKTTICWFSIYFLRAIDRYGGHSPLRKLHKGRRGQPMLDRSVASAASPVLVFSHNIEIGRAGKGGKGGGKSCWVSVVFIFLACARPPGRPKTCTDRCGQKGTSGKLRHLSHKSLCPCVEKWARNPAQKMGSFFERPPRPARLGLTYFANTPYIACPPKIHPEYFPVRSPSRPRRRGASSPRASRRRRIGNPC